MNYAIWAFLVGKIHNKDEHVLAFYNWMHICLFFLSLIGEDAPSQEPPIDNFFFLIGKGVLLLYSKALKVFTSVTN